MVNWKSKQSERQTIFDLEGFVDVLLQVTVRHPLPHQVKELRQVDVAAVVRVHRVRQILNNSFRDLTWPKRWVFSFLIEETLTYGISKGSNINLPVKQIQSKNINNNNYYYNSSNNNNNDNNNNNKWTYWQQEFSLHCAVSTFENEIKFSHNQKLIANSLKADKNTKCKFYQGLWHLSLFMLPSNYNILNSIFDLFYFILSLPAILRPLDFVRVCRELAEVGERRSVRHCRCRTSRTRPSGPWSDPPRSNLPFLTTKLF